MTTRNLQFKFKEVASATNTNPFDQLHKGLDSILSYGLRDIPAEDKVGLLIHNESAPDRPVVVSFRHKDQMSIDVVWGVLNKVLQSNATF